VVLASASPPIEFVGLALAVPLPFWQPTGLLWLRAVTACNGRAQPGKEATDAHDYTYRTSDHNETSDDNTETKDAEADALSGSLPGGRHGCGAHGCCAAGTSWLDHCC